MPPKRRGRPSPAQKATTTNLQKEGISIGLVTDEEEEENELGGATLEFNPAVGHEGMRIQYFTQKTFFFKTLIYCVYFPRHFIFSCYTYDI